MLPWRWKKGAVLLSRLAGGPSGRYEGGKGRRGGKGRGGGGSSLHPSQRLSPPAQANQHQGTVYRFCSKFCCGWDLAECGWDLAEVSGWDLAEVDEI